MKHYLIKYNGVASVTIWLTKAENKDIAVENCKALVGWDIPNNSIKIIEIESVEQKVAEIYDWDDPEYEG